MRFHHPLPHSLTFSLSLLPSDLLSLTLTFSHSPSQGVDVQEDQRMSIMKMCKTFHTSVAEQSARFLSEAGRHNYVRKGRKGKEGEGRPSLPLALLSSCCTTLQSLEPHP
jgi:hypothetical protein